ncbi:molybdopterin-binding protein [Mangrovibacterium marinum]|uniref:Molybdopterin-binding protein n=1 Tax=Mangrovibacterium marinum TaxID=1639118 RepID=A0A2T5C0R5_9BACT|nr:TOBE domain-containing protein [Mangrovibacterium marinum]PTN08202.1 molybdopterin-binding protein [Mangrovibacterium marinum]
MKLSAQNRMKGIVLAITEGLVISEINIELDNGILVDALITNSAVESLELEREGEVLVCVNAASVMLAAGDVQISARNIFPGKIESITDGMVSTQVVLNLGRGSELTALISKSSADEMELAVGQELVAVVNAWSVTLGLT